MQKQPDHEDIPLGLLPRGLAASHGTRGLTGLLRFQSDRQAKQLRMACLVDEHRVQANVEVGGSAVVGIGQAFQQVTHPAGNLLRIRRRIRLQALHERLAALPGTTHEGPAIVAADFHRFAQTRVFQARTGQHVLRPCLAFAVVGRLDTGHTQ